MGKGLPEDGQGKSRPMSHKDCTDWVGDRVIEAESPRCVVWRVEG